MFVDRVKVLGIDFEGGLGVLLSPHLEDLFEVWADLIHLACIHLYVLIQVVFHCVGTE